MSTVRAGPRPVPSWLITDSYIERDAGVLRSGKEGEVFLVERRAGERSCLLAHKRFRPRYPGKGELKELGFSKGTIYRADSVYRQGWNLKARERRAVAGGSRFGHDLAATLWPANEMAMLERAWAAGASVPYPVERTADGILMEYIGDFEQAAPHLVHARIGEDQLADAWSELVETLRAISSAGIVHGDLSPYNILWWMGRPVVIDFPQAVDATTNAHAPDLLHRDVANICGWFEWRNVEIDRDELYAELLSLLFGGGAL